MNTYFAYVRVSTVRQGEQGTSPQEQRHAIEHFAARENLQISRWYEERETAAKRGRLQFNQMLRDIRRHKPAGIIIHKIDRSARNLGDWSLLLDLVDAGTKVRFAHDNVDLASRGGRLTANIQAVMAADYSRNLSDEVRKGQLGRLRQGLWPLRAPYGYIDTGKGKVKKVHPVRAALVREAFTLYATGSYSIDALRHEMAARGLRQPRGNPLSASHMGHLLHNPFYVGLMRFSRLPEVFQGKHKPIVELALYEKVQCVLTGKGAAKIQRNDFAFKRRIRCAACHRALTGERVKGHIYYRCHAKSCPRVSMRENDIDDDVCVVLARLYLCEVDVGDFRDILTDLIQEERRGERDRIVQTKRDIANIDARLSLLTDALLDQSVDRDSYIAKKEELLLSRRALSEKIEQPGVETFWERVAKKFELGFVALPRYISGLDGEKRSIVDSISSNLIARGKELDITLLSPFAEWVEWIKTQKCWHSQVSLRKGDLFRQFLLSLPQPDNSKEGLPKGANPPL